MVHAVDDRGALVTARTRPALLGFTASLDSSGVPLVDGRSWDSETVAQVVGGETDDIRLVTSDGGHRFDDTPLLIGTDGAIEWMGVDGRRFRPNIVIAGVQGLDEREWPGRHLNIGAAVIRVEKVCKRCVMTTFDPDSLDQDPEVLRRIKDELDGRFALNCHVEAPGTIAIGDPVEVL